MRNAAVTIAAADVAGVGTATAGPKTTRSHATTGLRSQSTAPFAMNVFKRALSIAADRDLELELGLRRNGRLHTFTSTFKVVAAP